MADIVMACTVMASCLYTGLQQYEDGKLDLVTCSKEINIYSDHVEAAGGKMLDIYTKCSKKCKVRHNYKGHSYVGHGCMGQNCKTITMANTCPELHRLDHNYIGQSYISYG